MRAEHGLNWLKSNWPSIDCDLCIVWISCVLFEIGENSISIIAENALHMMLFVYNFNLHAPTLQIYPLLIIWAVVWHPRPSLIEQLLIAKLLAAIDALLPWCLWSLDDRHVPSVIRMVSVDYACDSHDSKHIRELKVSLVDNHWFLHDTLTCPLGIFPSGRNHNISYNWLMFPSLYEELLSRIIRMDHCRWFATHKMISCLRNNTAEPDVDEKDKLTNRLWSCYIEGSLNSSCRTIF